MFRMQDKDMHSNDWFYERGVVDARKEEISHFTKSMSSHLIQRKFDKDNSVFRDWKMDNQFTYKRCFEGDMNHWKVPKMKVKPEDLDEITELLESNYSELKEIITWL